VPAPHHGVAAQALKAKEAAMANTTTKKELQDTLDEVGSRISDMLDPALSREQLVEQLQELDEMLNGSDDDDSEDEGEEEEEEEA
jgi:hypothetical protein